MSAAQTADANTKEVEGQLPVEGSSATTAQQPNTPANDDLSGVGQAPTEPQASDTGVEGEQPEPAAPDAPTEGEPPQSEPSAEEKEKAVRKIEGQKRYQELLSQVKQYKERFGPIPSVGVTPPQTATAAPQPATPAPQPSATMSAIPVASDPYQSAIEQENQKYWQARQLWESVEEGSPQKAFLAAQANAALQQVKLLERKQIVEEVSRTYQQQQAQAQRFGKFMSEVAEVNEQLPPEIKILDAGGRFNLASEGSQAIAAKAYHTFGIPPQELVNAPEILAYCAKDLALRFNGAVNQTTAFNQKQIANKQKQIAKRVGIEEGGAPAPAPVSKQAARVRELEKLAKQGNRDAINELNAMSLG